MRREKEVVFVGFCATVKGVLFALERLEGARRAVLPKSRHAPASVAKADHPPSETEYKADADSSGGPPPSPRK